MMPCRKIGFFLCTAALAALPLFCLAAAVRGQQDPQGPLRIQVALVNLFATVRDKHTKQIVSTLEQKTTSP